MPSTLGRNLNLCFSKIMRTLTPESESPPISTATFNSLYDHSSEPQPADFATAFASQRFFFSSPGLSNSIVESSSTAIAPPQPHCQKLFTNSVAVPTYSPDPYLDFRRSMQEMVEARPELMDVKSNWEILHELLLCYLALNPKTTHKFIVGAFADLLVSLMSPSNPEEMAAGGGGAVHTCKLEM